MKKRKFREKPFCWQEKEIIRYIQQNFRDKSKAPAIALYIVLTLKASDQDNEARTRNKLIYLARTTGLRFDRVKNLLRKFRKLKIIKSRQEITKEGKFGDTLVVLLTLPPSVKSSKIPQIDESKKTKQTECKIQEGKVKNKHKTECKISSKTECKKGKSFSETDVRFGKTNESNNKKNIYNASNKKKTMSQIISSLISYFKYLVRQKKGITPEINYAVAKDRIRDLLLREENPYTPEQIEGVFDWYVGSEKYEKFGASITTALSSHSLNMFNELSRKGDWQYVQN